MDSAEGAELKTILDKALNGNCDVRTGYYGELEVAATFHKDAADTIVGNCVRPEAA